jgi:hypothetical protein
MKRYNCILNFRKSKEKVSDLLTAVVLFLWLFSPGVQATHESLNVRLSS